jgi:hypothetical protein
MNDEQKPVAWLNKDGVIVGTDEGGTAKPLYLHHSPAVVAVGIHRLFWNF